MQMAANFGPAAAARANEQLADLPTDRRTGPIRLRPGARPILHK